MELSNHKTIQLPGIRLFGFNLKKARKLLMDHKKIPSQIPPLIIPKKGIRLDLNLKMYTNYSWTTNLHQKRALPKGKVHLNRGSIHSPYLPSPFLLSAQTPGLGMPMQIHPSAGCLNRIEPRFEPQTPRGRLFTPKNTVFRPFPPMLFLCAPSCPSC